MTATQSLIQAAFQAAMSEFKTNLKNDKLYAEILTVKSIDEVYDLTDKLQAEQGKSGRLRHLAKIEPYLNRLQEYTGVIEVFLQVQPEIIALIWGPIKLLLQWSSVLTKSFDAIVSATADIGLLLPEFQEVAVLFSQNTRIYEVLVLFFKDILDFYQIGLKFFTMSRWKYFFESIWPRKREHIGLVKTHIERHTLLMRNEVRLEHIREEHEARLKALEHFRKSEQSQRLQQYHAIKTEINPRSYDEKLNWYHGRVCKGTGAWLLQEDAFKKWLNKTNGTSRVLWIQGIPGAGKTFLAGSVVDNARAIGLTAFAFLTHTLSSSTSALSILHSLIFHLADQNTDLQDVICHSIHEHSKSDISRAAALLKSILDCAGSVYLIVDGLDEIDITERRIFLLQLLELTRDCAEIRVLISSRREDDIIKALDGVSESIRVDQRNEESIQAFVDFELRQMFENRGFAPELRAEFSLALSGLASMAKGMFLYATVVLRGLELVDDVAEIRAYLSVLPEDLNDAYARILSKVEQLPPLARDKARKILGWVGCSPTPLSLQEIEHALAIQAGSLEPTKTPSMPPNLGRLCGPIVEIANGYVQFVHFTVKEYLFSPSIAGHISLAGATLDLAIQCVTLFCQEHYDLVNLDDDRYFTRLVIDGSYKLHYFAISHWFTLIQTYLQLSKNEPISDRLLLYLGLMAFKRRNTEFAATREAFVAPAHLQPLQAQHPEIYELCADLTQFYETCSHNAYHIAKDESWLDLDPLTILSYSATVYRKLKKSICVSNLHKAQCSCDAIHRCFGNRPLKCGFVKCSFQHHGFETKVELEQHEEKHSRSWRCSVSGCEYEKTGFISPQMRDQHLQKAHRGNVSLKDVLPQNGLGESETIIFLLIDLIKRDEIATAELLISNTTLFQKMHAWELWIYIGKFGSIAMAELFRQHIVSHYAMPNAFTGAIETGNVNIINWLLGSECLDFSNQRVLDLMRHTSPEVNRLTKKYVDLSLTKSRDKGYVAQRCFFAKTIAATSRIPDKEESLISTWELAISNLKSPLKSISVALSDVAKTTCSIPLAKALLNYGANIEGRGPPAYPPLLCAAQVSSPKNAEFMKFLLFEGANPDPVWQGKKRAWGKVSGEKCAREMSRWLGISWSELVAQAAEYRKGLDTRPTPT